jgi:hypothetical protein
MKIPLRPIGKALLWLLDKAFGVAMAADAVHSARKKRARDELIRSVDRNARTVIIPKRRREDDR